MEIIFEDFLDGSKLNDLFSVDSSIVLRAVDCLTRYAVLGNPLMGFAPCCVGVVNAEVRYSIPYAMGIFSNYFQGITGYKSSKSIRNACYVAQYADFVYRKVNVMDFVVSPDTVDSIRCMVERNIKFLNEYDIDIKKFGIDINDDCMDTRSKIGFYHLSDDTLVKFTIDKNGFNEDSIARVLRDYETVVQHGEKEFRDVKRLVVFNPLENSVCEVRLEEGNV